MPNGRIPEETVQDTRVHALEAALAEAQSQIQALATREAETRALLDSTSDGIISVDEEGRIVSCNPAAEQLFACRTEEMVGRPVFDLFPPHQHSIHERILTACRTADRPMAACRNIEVLGLRKDGSTFPFALSVYRVHAESRVLFTGIMHDLSERRRAEHALVRVSETVRETIGQELHDVLGQQLTGISLLAKGLHRAIETGAGRTAEDAAEIHRLAAAALRETRRLAHGLYPVELERHGLGAALAEMAFASEKLFGVPCRMTGRLAPDRVSKMTALHLYRIAQEAVTNAVKHAETSQVVISVNDRGQFLELDVTDDGRGIDPDAPPRHGMGLSIMQYRAQMIGARLGITNGPRGGTCVNCVLPLDMESDTAGGAGT